MMSMRPTPPLPPQRKRRARNKNEQQCAARRLVRAGALRLSTEGAPGRLAELAHTGANRVRALQQAANPFVKKEYFLTV